MTISKEEAARLMDHGYANKDDPVPFVEGAKVEINNREFKVLKIMDNPDTGYQGSIYQETVTGEFVVMHRGTEFDRELYQDGAIADGGMVIARFNAQLADAQKLVDEAKKMAKDPLKWPDGITAPPQITHSGHSLGGNISQVMAYKNDHGGQAFNPYGALSLKVMQAEGVPLSQLSQGHSAFINHISATDPVAASSPHYGQTRIYATQADVLALRFSGAPSASEGSIDFLNDAASLVNSAHSSKNFVGPDSIMTDENLARYQTHRQEFHSFHDNVLYSRQWLTYPGQVAESARFGLQAGGSDPLLSILAFEAHRRNLNPLPETPNHLRHLPGEIDRATDAVQMTATQVAGDVTQATLTKGSEILGTGARVAGTTAYLMLSDTLEPVKRVYAQAAYAFGDKVEALGQVAGSAVGLYTQQQLAKSQQEIQQQWQEEHGPLPPLHPELVNPPAQQARFIPIENLVVQQNIAAPNPDEWRQQSSYANQRDSQGRQWRFDADNPELGWQHSYVTRDPVPMQRFTTHTIRADAQLSDALTYQASVSAVKQLLDNPPPARDPYTLPASASDTPSQSRADWQRDPATGHWQREVVDQFSQTPAVTPMAAPQIHYPSHTEIATPPRAAELDQQAQAVLEQNAANSWPAIAARFESAYQQNGWAKYGPIPEEVTLARGENALTASNGVTYAPITEDRWAQRGIGSISYAKDTIHQELNATAQVLDAGFAKRQAAPTQQITIGIGSVGISQSNAASPDNDHNMREQQRAERQRQIDDFNRQSNEAAQQQLLAEQQRQREERERREESERREREEHDRREESERREARQHEDQSRERQQQLDKDREQQHSKDREPATAQQTTAASANAAERSGPTPADPDHPKHVIYQQVRTGVIGMFNRHDMPFDDAKVDRYAAALMVDVIDRDLKKVDSVCYSGKHAPEFDNNFLAVQNPINKRDPHLMAFAKVADADVTPAQVSLNQAQDTHIAQVKLWEQIQEKFLQEQMQQSYGPRMSM